MLNKDADYSATRFQSPIFSHKIRHQFKDTLNPLGSCRNKAETITHLSYIAILYAKRGTQMNDLKNTDNFFT